jgi:hypothetical protein
MAAVFEPVPAAEVDRGIDAYGAYLAERDGEPDFERRTLSRREAGARAFEQTALRWGGPFAHGTFEAQYRRYDRRVATSPEEALLLVFAKINANEAYGVDRVLRTERRQNPRAAGLERLVLLEETYHTRLLLSACAVFGARVSGPARPAAATRAIVGGIAELPEAAARPVLLAGEILGILTFMGLIGAVRRVFKDDGAIRDALEERVSEVLVDEVGHMSFNRLFAAPGTFAALRALLPLFALGTRGALPEAESLGILPLRPRDVLAFDVGALPEEIRRRAFIA